MDYAYGILEQQATMGYYSYHCNKVQQKVRDLMKKLEVYCLANPSEEIYIFYLLLA